MIRVTDEMEPIRFNRAAYKRIFGGWSYYRDAPKEYFELVDKLPGTLFGSRIDGEEEFSTWIKYGKRSNVRVAVRFKKDGCIEIIYGYERDKDKKYPIECSVAAMKWIAAMMHAFFQHGLI